jgi:hypothetical protein
MIDWTWIPVIGVFAIILLFVIPWLVRKFTEEQGG